MSDIQNDEIYKSSLKSLAVYTGRVAKLYLSDDAEQDDIMNYQATLIELYPVIKNLALELNVYYNAHIEIPKVEFDSAIEEIDALLPLLTEVRKEFKTNQKFSSTGLLFDFESPHFSGETKNTIAAVEAFEDKQKPNKAMYWFYNNIQAVDSYFNHLYNRESDKFWETLSETELGEVLASRLPATRTSGAENDELANTLLNSIYDAGIRYMEAGTNKKKLDIAGEILKRLKKEYKINIKSPAFKEALSEQLPEIMRIYRRHEAGFLKLDCISDTFDEIDDRIWDYEDEEIYEMIAQSSQRESGITFGNIHKLVLSQQDVDAFVNNYDDYKNLRAETIREYREYTENKTDYDQYQTSYVYDDVLRDMLSLQVKSWLADISREAKKIIPPLADLGGGHSRFGTKEEYAVFVDTALDLALDVVLASRAVAVYVPVPDRNGETMHIELNRSEIGENYVSRLMNEPKRLKIKDYQSLAVLINTFEYNYNHFRPSLSLSREQAQMLKDFDNEFFLQRLEAASDSLDKMDMAYVSARIYHQKAKQTEKEISEQRNIFTKNVNTLHPKEREALTDYIDGGCEIYPDLNKEKVLNAIDHVVSSLVLMPIYAVRRYSENDYCQGRDYMLEKSGLPADREAFVRSAMDGYKKSLLPKYQLLSNEGKLRPLHFLAANCGNMMQKFNELSDCRERLEVIQQNQLALYNKYAQMSEYENTTHPGKDYITGLLLNSKLNTR